MRIHLPTMWIRNAAFHHLGRPLFKKINSNFDGFTLLFYTKIDSNHIVVGLDVSLETRSAIETRNLLWFQIYYVGQTLLCSL